MSSFTIRPVERTDRNWIAQFLDKHWGSTRIVTRGQVYLGHLLDGFIAEQDSKPVGLITYRFDGDACEIVTINSLAQGQGIGTALLEAVKQAALEAGCRRLWLITTNDNMPALRFCQKRGFHLVAVYPNALEASRRLKPEIPLFGLDGIPLRDEIELELTL
ncbi:MAG: GNAT family N-acetyltransferase [Aggregatilineales bacterium]